MPVPCAVRGVEVPHGRIVAESGFADHIVLVYAILVLVVVLEPVGIQQLAQLLEGASGCFRVGLAVVENVAFHRALPVDIRLSFPTSLGIQRGRGLRLGYIRWKRIAVHQFKGEILDGRLVFLVRLLPGQHAATSRGAAIRSRPATGQQHHCGQNGGPASCSRFHHHAPSDDCTTVANH